MARSRRGLVSSVIALTVVTGLSVWALNLEGRTERVRMPDGSTVAFMGLAYGTGPGITQGRPWQRLLYPIAPPQLRAPFMKDVVQLPPDPWPGSLSLWFHHSGYFPVSTNVGARRLLTVDSHGCPFEWGYWGLGLEYQGGFAVPARVRAYPRRERAMEHRYLVRTARAVWTPLMRVPSGSPGAGQFPQWKPLPLPQTRAAGELEVTLEELRAPAPLWIDSAIPDDRSVMTEVRLRSGGSEALRGEWKPVEITLEDATGNRHQREDLKVLQLDDHQPKVEWKAGGKPGEWTVRVPGGLCSNEDAWKVRVEWSRHTGTSDPPDEVWSVKNFPLPGQYQNRRFVLGPGIETLIEGMSEVKHSRAAAMAMRTVPEGRRFRLEVTDDRGRRWKVRDWGMNDPAILQTRQREFVFGGPKDSRWVDLKVLVYNTRIVEFLARPSVRR